MEHKEHRLKGGAAQAPTTPRDLTPGFGVIRIQAHAPARGNETASSPALCGGNRTRCPNVTQAEYVARRERDKWNTTSGHRPAPAQPVANGEVNPS